LFSSCTKPLTKKGSFFISRSSCLTFTSYSTRGSLTNFAHNDFNGSVIARLSSCQSEKCENDESNVKSKGYEIKDIDEENLIMLYIKYIADKFEKVSQENANSEPSQITKLFSCQTTPEISSQDFITRLVMILNETYDDSPSITGTGIRCLVIASIYIDRVLEFNHDLLLHPESIHWLLLASFISAIKFTEEATPDVQFLASMGGVDNHQVLVGERRFCKCIGFRFWINDYQYESRLKEIQLGIQNIIEFNSGCEELTTY